MVLIRQNVGIDIAKDTFTACVCKRYLNSKEEYSVSESKTFANTKTGFNQFLKWVRKNVEKELAVVYCMEATGIYYESLAYHLNNLGKRVSVLLPNKVSHFGKSLNIKTKTDDIDAKVISIMGCERTLEKWIPPSPIYKELRSYTRLYQSLKSDKTQTINRLKQVECGFAPEVAVVRVHKRTIKRIDLELKSLLKLIKATLKSDEEIWTKVENVMTINGVGLITVAMIIAETQGFALIKNQRQLTSYCGYDVVKRESGTSIKGRTKISKKGNSRIRASLFMPSLSAVRYNKKMKEVYDRINEGKKVKTIGLVAVQRRLLVLIYTIWKKNEQYDETYTEKKISDNHEERGSSSSSTRRVETSTSEEKVVGTKELPTTQNEHLHNQLSEALLRQ